MLLTSEQLDAEFVADSKKTVQKYARRVIQVTGRLSRVSCIAGEMRYHLTGGPVDGRPITVGTQYFIRAGEPWYCVRPGQTVTLVGEGFPAHPSLINCEVVRSSGTPLPTISAVALAELLQRDRAEFRKRFYLQQIMVTGEVTQVSQSESISSQLEVRLKSTQSTSVVCEMCSDETFAADSVKIGDSVTITGWNIKESPTDSIQLLQCLIWRGK